MRGKNIKMISKMNERERMLRGIEEEIEKLNKQKDELPDYENRIEELEKEAKALRKDLGIV